ncbi:methyl-accepting chemotaxis protein [Paraburkholderia adhaesiva]|uniref:methyl-accepting chemotaxis protein n=1 Tax=Paraburkholderia adhaesiva TaxID=2883244 RepID=UPI0027E4E90D|nr:methyl-accepting chemotaxis protein [Paraburkholderia adhaesiva]
MKRTSLNRKAWSIVALLWISLVVLVVADAIMTRQSLWSDREDMLAQQTETAMGVVAFYQKQAASGQISADEAKRQAIATLRGLRYGANQSGYFGIYDSQYMGVMIPPKPELENKSQADMVDPQGTHVAVEIVKSALPGGNHISHYVWPKAGNSEPVDKITYAEAVPEWGWALFTGAYVDDIQAAFLSALMRNLALVAVIGVAVTLGMLWLIRNIRTSLGGEPDYATEICTRIAAGDFTTQVKLANGDNGSLLYAMGEMQKQLVDTVRRIQTSAESITTGSNEIATGNLDLSSRTEEQAASLEETAASMEELTATVKHNTDNARQGNTLAVNASEVAARGGDVVRRVVSTMHEISSTSERVEQIIGVIDGIAFQTNILALNAAVEAARAGEHGRGFAVVASEVRALAQRSATAVKEIEGLIAESVTTVETGYRIAGEASTTMRAIVARVEEVRSIIGDISAASREQSGGIEQVNLAVTQIGEATQQNAALVGEAERAAIALNEQAARLAGLVAVFNVGAQTRG